MKNFLKNMIENKEYQFDKFVFYVCLIDNLFLPYVWFISIPYTMPLLYFWVLRRYHDLIKNVKYQLEYKLFLIFVILMSFSTFYSFILAPQYAYKNIVYLIQFTTMFLYYFLFIYYINQYDFKVIKFLLVFVIFVVVLAVFFNLDKAFYNHVILFWNNRSGILINENLYKNFDGYRYSFIWMDANNIGYMMNAIVLYLWCNEKTNFFIKIFSLLSLLFILISCMSNGALLSFSIGVGIYMLITLRNLLKGKYMQKYKITVANILLFMITLVILYKIIEKIPQFLETNVAMESLERINHNSGESRFEIWNYVFDHVNFLEYILIGKGGVTLVNGIKFSPHNGHLYLILGYGFLAYFIFMYFIFRKRSTTSFEKYIWIIPIFIGFSVNVLLGEIKMMNIIMLLIACSSSKRYLYQNNN